MREREREGGRHLAMAKAIELGGAHLERSTHVTANSRELHQLTLPPFSTSLYLLLSPTFLLISKTFIILKSSCEGAFFPWNAFHSRMEALTI